LEVSDELAELLDPVLHRHPGEEQDPLGVPGCRGDDLRPLRTGILHVVRLVHDQHRDLRSANIGQCPQGAEGRDGDAADL